MTYTYPIICYALIITLDDTKVYIHSLFLGLSLLIKYYVGKNGNNINLHRKHASMKNGILFQQKRKRKEK